MVHELDRSILVNLSPMNVVHTKTFSDALPINDIPNSRNIHWVFSTYPRTYSNMQVIVCSILHIQYSYHTTLDKHYLAIPWGKILNRWTAKPKRPRDSICHDPATAEYVDLLIDSVGTSKFIDIDRRDYFKDNWILRCFNGLLIGLSIGKLVSTCFDSLFEFL